MIRDYTGIRDATEPASHHSQIALLKSAGMSGYAHAIRRSILILPLRYGHLPKLVSRRLSV